MVLVLVVVVMMRDYNLLEFNSIPLSESYHLISVGFEGTDFKRAKPKKQKLKFQVLSFVLISFKIP
jgi:hypothetical protein